MNAASLRIQFVIFSIWYWLNHLPVRGYRILRSLAVDSWKSPTLGTGQSNDKPKTSGLLDVPLSILLRALIQVIEFIGLAELLQILWVSFLPSRKLTEEETAAFREVIPVSNMPYHLIRVCEDSIICRISGGRAVATMHVIHLPEGRHSLDLMVHEMGHTAQFQLAGAVYMAEALHAQFFGEGYDYGDLEQIRADGKSMRDLNREQQAQILQDFYRIKHGQQSHYGCTEESARPFVEDFRNEMA